MLKTNRKIVPLSKLPLANDFMFGEVMRNDKVCKLFLEELLGKKIDRIVYIDKQADLSDGADAHGIRLDLYLADDNNTHYDIEMQQFSRKALEMRIRYYQSGIDRRTLEKANDYRHLSQSYVIFVCDFDYYQRGSALYERTIFVNGWSDLPYDDGSHVVILNSRYIDANASPAILEFLDYIRTKDDAMQMFNELGRETKKAVDTVRSDKSKEVPYMTWSMKMRDMLEDGIEIGREQGREEGRLEGCKETQEKAIQAMIAVLRKINIDPKQTAQLLCESFDLSMTDAEEKVKLYGQM